MALKMKGYWKNMGWNHSSLMPLNDKDYVGTLPSMPIVVDQDLVRRSVQAARNHRHASELIHEHDYDHEDGVDGDEHSPSSSYREGEETRKGQCICYPCSFHSKEPSNSPSSLGRRSLDSAISPQFRAELLARLEGPVRNSVSYRPRRRSASSASTPEGPSKARLGRIGSIEDVYEKTKPMEGEEPCLFYVRKRMVNEHFDLRSLASGLYVKVKSADMPISMQLHAVQLTKEVLESQETLSLMETARLLKKEFDSSHGYVWHCIVGGSFGSYVTHSVGSSIYFSVGKLAILLFKTSVPSLSPSQ